MMNLRFLAMIITVAATLRGAPGVQEMTVLGSCPIVVNSGAAIAYPPNVSEEAYNLHIRAKGSEECSICLAPLKDEDEQKQLYQTPCGHFFHARCLGGWHKNSCPNCRSEIKDSAFLDLVGKIANEVIARLREQSECTHCTIC